MRDTSTSKKDFDPEITVVAYRIPYEPNENLSEKVNLLVQQGLEIMDLDIVQVTRTPVRQGRPGIVKIECHNLQDKLRILRSKELLRQKAGWMKNVYLRSSKTHIERLMDLNFRTIIDDLNGEYKITGNGRIEKVQTSSPLQHSPHEHGSARAQSPDQPQSVLGVQPSPRAQSSQKTQGVPGMQPTQQLYNMPRAESPQQTQGVPGMQPMQPLYYTPRAHSPQQTQGEPGMQPTQQIYNAPRAQSPQQAESAHRGLPMQQSFNGPRAQSPLPSQSAPRGQSPQQTQYSARAPQQFHRSPASQPTQQIYNTPRAQSPQHFQNNR